MGVDVPKVKTVPVYESSVTIRVMASGCIRRIDLTIRQSRQAPYVSASCELHQRRSAKAWLLSMLTANPWSTDCKLVPMTRLQSRQKASAQMNFASRDVATDSAVKMKTTAPPPRKFHATSTDYLTDRATLFFIRRTLCPQVGDKGRNTSTTTIDEILPPLTSSNDVDLQLYAFIAIIVREYIQTWYQKITPDQTFVEELVKIIAHCTRAVEQRLRKVDLESLLFDEIPELVDAHVQAFRISHLPLYNPPFEQDARRIYHSLWPSPALEPVPEGPGSIFSAHQLDNESTYRRLMVQGILALLLPTEDLENTCLTSLVGEILSEIIGGAIGDKATEPWILWEGITKLAELVKSQMPKTIAQVKAERSPDYISGNDKKYWSVKIRVALASLQNLALLILQFLCFAFITVRFFVTIIATSSSLPPRNGAESKAKGRTKSLDQDSLSLEYDELSFRKPLLTMKIWECTSNLLELDLRMPWVKATLSLLQWKAMTGPGKVGQTDAIIDRILSHTIKTQILAPSVLPTLLRSARAALFPHNTLAPARPTPDSSECRAIRRRCAEALLDLIPPGVRDVYFGSQDREKIVQEVEHGLGVVGSKYCNKHLIYGLVELVLVRLMPELAECGIEELLEQRLN